MSSGASGDLGILTGNHRRACVGGSGTVPEGSCSVEEESGQYGRSQGGSVREEVPPLGQRQNGGEQGAFVRKAGPRRCLPPLPPPTVITAHIERWGGICEAVLLLLLDRNESFSMRSTFRRSDESLKGLPDLIQSRRLNCPTPETLEDTLKLVFTKTVEFQTSVPTNANSVEPHLFLLGGIKLNLCFSLRSGCFCSAPHLLFSVDDLHQPLWLPVSVGASVSTSEGRLLLLLILLILDLGFCL